MTDASVFQLGFNKVDDALVCIMHHSAFEHEPVHLENYLSLMGTHGGIGLAEIDNDLDLTKVRSSFMSVFHGDAKKTLELLDVYRYVVVDYNFIIYMINKGVHPTMIRHAFILTDEVAELPELESIRATIRGFLKLGYTKAQVWQYYKYFQRWRSAVDEYEVTELTDYQIKMTDWVDGIMMRLPFMMSMPHRVHKTLIKQEAALLRIQEDE